MDVYAVNPCDLLGRPHNYSPLLLRLPPPFGEAAMLRPLGLAMALGFAASLLWLPAAPRGGFFVMLLAILSPVTAFALERANVDLLIFLLVVPGAVLLAQGQAARIGGFALFLLAGLVKFYPLMLLLLLLRERPGILFALLLVASAILHATLGPVGGEVRRALGNIPVQAVFWDSFGAANLPRGAHLLTGSPVAAALALAAGLAAAGLAARRMLRDRGLAHDLSLLREDARCLLLVSAILVAGCFLAVENIEYRAILLLPALPALLAADATRPTGWLAAALMWEPVARRLVERLGPGHEGPLSAPGLVLWVLHNLAWWWLAGVLIALVFSQLRVARGLALFRP